MEAFAVLLPFVVSVVVLLGVVTIAFFLAKKRGRYDSIDALWPRMFLVVVAVGIVMAPQTPQAAWLSLLVFLLVLIWSERLRFHIAMRLARSPREDPRYTQLRSKWKGKHEHRKIYLRIFVTQAILASVVALPALVVVSHHTIISFVPAGIGIGMWIVGFVIEAVADRQLSQFVRTNKTPGALMTKGLWKYSRHPNYFGELLQWWAIAIIALAVPGGWIGLVGPLLLTFLIVFISGIPMAEARFKGRPQWDAYKRRTSPLVLWPPHK